MRGARAEAQRGFLEGLFAKWLAVDRTGDQDAKPTKDDRALGARAAATAMRELGAEPAELTLDV